MSGKWKFIPFSGLGPDIYLGRIEMPNGQTLADVARGLDFYGKESDEQIVQRVVEVLNRELPNGQKRKHYNCTAQKR